MVHDGAVVARGLLAAEVALVLAAAVGALVLEAVSGGPQSGSHGRFWCDAGVGVDLLQHLHGKSYEIIQVQTG